MKELLVDAAVETMERGLVGDRTMRWAIRRLCASRLRQEEARNSAGAARLISEMRTGPVALSPEKANEQHYEAPVALFRHCLGRRLKYSCCFWPEGVRELDEAEEAALDATCRHAGISDGMDILELGCGWGSLTLWMAEKFPNAHITAVTNSALQHDFILGKRESEGIRNVRIVRADMNAFEPGSRFDRIVSVEMFEHMRNYRELLHRVSTWMRREAKLFVHVFAHRSHVYAFETEGAANWMGRHFFTGGVMPSKDIFHHFQDHVRVSQSWWWDGLHYQKTAEAWLARMDADRNQLLPVLADAYGEAEAPRWFQRWRMFFIACAELFGFRHGREWGVGHYLLEK